MASKPPATIYDLLQLQAGDKDNATWVNDEFEAVVSDIKNGQKSNSCRLSDPHNPGVQITAVFWDQRDLSRFNGCVCHFAGQGMKRTEYKGEQQVSMSAKSTVNIVGRATNQGGQNAGSGQPQGQRQGNPAGAGPGPSSASSAIHGATVGMAINQACGLIKDTQQPLELSYLHSPAFSKDLYLIASDIIRISRVLESGKLAPNPAQRADPEFAKKQADAAEAEKKAAEAAEAARKAEEAKQAAAASGGASSSSQGNLDQDVPF